MTPKTVNALSAAFAVSNRGLEVDEDRVDWALKSRNTDIDSMVCLFGEQYIESDDHYDMFVRGAVGWRDRLEILPPEKIRSTWPHTWVETILDAEQTNAK